MGWTGGKLTVFFEDPFWVGVFEQTEDGKLSASKVTFGAEPKDCEVWKFVLRHYDELTFSPAVEAETRPAAGNPKRRQREAGKQMQDSGIGTKSQRALQLQHEEMKAERKEASRERRKAEARQLFELRQQKRKEKHRGH